MWAATGAAAHGYLYGRHHIELTRTILRRRGLPDALAGLRIGFMTDLHRSATVPHELIESAATLLMAERPDLVVLGGDYVTWGGTTIRGSLFVEPAAEARARRCRRRTACSASSATTTTIATCRRPWPRRGVEILRDARTRLTIRGEPLDLIGIRYWTTRGRDIATVARGAARASILLAHNPTRLNEAAALVAAPHAERPHPRRPDRAAGPRSHRRARVPDHLWHGPARNARRHS